MSSLNPKIVRNEIFVEIKGGVGAGANNFLQLLDTPPSYAGEGGNFVRVNVAENALEFTTSSASVSWGAITGTLSNQTDLQSALDGKLSSVQAGTNVTIDNTDPQNPIINTSASGTNLSYTASPTDGTVISDTGTDATLPLADSTNAGLMSPSQNDNLTDLNFNYTDVVFLGKHGNDSNDGLSPDQAVLTANEAETVAESLTTGSNRVVIECLDAGTYSTGNLTVDDNIDLHAPNATFEARFVLRDDTNISVFKLVDDGTTFPTLNKNAGTLNAEVDIDIIDMRGIAGTTTGGIGIRNQGGGGILRVTNKALFVCQGGTGIGDTTGGFGHIHFTSEDLYLAGNNAVGMESFDSGSEISVVARIGHILELGNYTGTVGVRASATSSLISVITGEIQADIAVDVEAGGSANVYSGKITGNINVASGGTLYIDCTEYSGTVTNNGTIIGRIGSTVYGGLTVNGFSTAGFVKNNASGVLSGGNSIVITDVTNLQTELDGKVDENTAITGDTKTKITYDSKGLVTAGADAGLDDLSDVTKGTAAGSTASTLRILADPDTDGTYTVVDWTPPTGGSGEVNTGSNLGTGVGVFEGKSGVDLQFNSLVSQTGVLTIAEDDPNNEIDFTIDTDLSLYNNTTSGFISDLSGFTTTDLAEGTNLYYTDVRVSANTDVAANTADRHSAVTLSGTPNYITLSGQDIVRGLIDLTTDVSGTLPIANGGTGQTTQQAAINTLTNVAGATNEHVLTKDTATGDAIFKAVSTGATSLNDLTDVTITSVSDTQLLFYDDTDSRWENASPNAIIVAGSNVSWSGDRILNLDNNIDIDGLTISTFSSAGFVKNDASGVISGGNTVSLNDLTDVTIGTPVASTATTLRILADSNLNGTYTVFDWTPPTGGSGEVNTASNVGIAGVGVFKQKVGVDLEFKNVNAGSNKISVIDDTANDEIDIDINESNLTLSNLGGSVTDAQVPNTITLDSITQITSRSHTDLTDIGTNTHTQIDNHISDSTIHFTQGAISITASQVSDFDTEVSNNTDVAANTSARHDAVTLAASATTGGLSLTTQEIGFQAATSLQNGYLTSTDWNTFNNKQDSLTLGNLTESTSSVLTITGGTGAVVGSGTSIEVNTDLSQYDNTTSGFISGITGEPIGDLSDVTITTPADNELLAYDSGTGEWINQTPTEAGFATVATSGAYSDLSGTPTISGTNTGDQDLFSTIAVSGQSNVVADSTSDTLTLVAGTNITITTNATTDEITINSTASSSGDVTGPASSTDNAIARFDGTTGKVIQDSGVTIDDSNNVTINSAFTFPNADGSDKQTLETDGSGNVDWVYPAEYKTVYNDTGATIPKETLVRIDNSLGAFSTIVTADNSTCECVDGITVEDIGAAQTGRIQTVGTLNETWLNTSGLTAGSVLYLGTSGNYTETQPTSGFVIKVGKVGVVATSSGSIILSMPAYNVDFDELSGDLALTQIDTTGASTNDVITYNGSNAVWQAPSGGGYQKSNYQKLFEGLGSSLKVCMDWDFAHKDSITTFISSGSLYLSAIYIPEAMTITGVAWLQSTSGVYTANNYNGVGLYSYSGGTLTLVASSTSDGNIWKASPGQQKKAFSSPYSATEGVYYVALLYNSSSHTTRPRLLFFRVTGISDNFDFTNSADLSGAIFSSSSLPASVSTSSFSSSRYVWCALY